VAKVNHNRQKDRYFEPVPTLSASNTSAKIAQHDSPSTTHLVHRPDLTAQFTGLTAIYSGP